MQRNPLSPDDQIIKSILDEAEDQGLLFKKTELDAHRADAANRVAANKGIWDGLPPNTKDQLAETQVFGSDKDFNAKEQLRDTIHFSTDLAPNLPEVDAIKAGNNCTNRVVIQAHPFVNVGPPASVKNNLMQGTVVSPAFLDYKGPSLPGGPSFLEKWCTRPSGAKFYTLNDGVEAGLKEQILKTARLYFMALDKNKCNICTLPDIGCGAYVGGLNDKDDKGNGTSRKRAIDIIRAAWQEAAATTPLENLKHIIFNPPIFDPPEPNNAYLAAHPITQTNGVNISQAPGVDNLKLAQRLADKFPKLNVAVTIAGAAQGLGGDFALNDHGSQEEGVYRSEGNMSGQAIEHTKKIWKNDPSTSQSACQLVDIQAELALQQKGPSLQNIQALSDFDSANPSMIEARIAGAPANTNNLADKMRELQTWTTNNNLGLNFEINNGEIVITPIDAQIKKMLVEAFNKMEDHEKGEFIEKFRDPIKGEWDSYIDNLGKLSAAEKTACKEAFKTYNIGQRRTFQDDPNLFHDKLHEIERKRFVDSLKGFKMALDKPDSPKIPGLAQAVGALEAQADHEQNLRIAYKAVKELYDAPKVFFERAMASRSVKDEINVHKIELSKDDPVYKANKQGYKDDTQYLEIFKEHLARINDPFTMSPPKDLVQPMEGDINEVCNQLKAKFQSPEFARAFREMIYCMVTDSQMLAAKSHAGMSDPRKRLMLLDTMLVTIDTNLKNLPELSGQRAQMSQLRGEINKFIKNDELLDALRLANICSLKIRDLEEELKKGPDPEKENKKLLLERYKNQIEKDYLGAVNISLDNKKPQIKFGDPKALAQAMLDNPIISQTTGILHLESSTSVKLKDFIEGVEQRRFPKMAQPLVDICEDQILRLNVEIGELKKLGRGDMDVDIKAMNKEVEVLEGYKESIEKILATPEKRDFTALKEIAVEMLQNPSFTGAKPVKNEQPPITKIMHFIAKIDGLKEPSKSLSPPPNPDEENPPQTDVDMDVKLVESRGRTASSPRQVELKANTIFAIQDSPGALMRVTVPAAGESGKDVLKRAQQGLESLLKTVNDPAGAPDAGAAMPVAPAGLPFGKRNEIREMVHMVPPNLHENLQTRLNAAGAASLPDIDAGNKIQGFGVLQSFDSARNRIKIKMVINPEEKEKYKDPNNLVALLDSAANIIKTARSTSGNPDVIRLGFMPRADYSTLNVAQQAMLIYCASSNLSIKGKRGDDIITAQSILENLTKDTKSMAALGLPVNCTVKDLKDRSQEILRTSDQIRVEEAPQIAQRGSRMSIGSGSGSV